MSTAIRCHNCGSSEFCLPFMLSKQELDRLESIIIRRPPIQKGQLLFKVGDRLDALYALRSGTVKSCTTTQQGEEQINAFYSAGDLVGFDAINTLVHPSSARVLDTSLICEIPFEPLDHLSSQMPSLRRQLLSLMSRQIKKDREQISRLSKKNAKERLATFLYMLMRNTAQQNCSSVVLQLSMTRSDMSNYLGLAVETVSRLLGTLQASGIITIQGRSVVIRDSNRLLCVANMGGQGQGQPLTLHNSVNRERPRPIA